MTWAVVAIIINRLRSGNKYTCVYSEMYGVWCYWLILNLVRSPLALLAVMYTLHASMSDIRGKAFTQY